MTASKLAASMQLLDRHLADAAQVALQVCADAQNCTEYSAEAFQLQHGAAALLSSAIELRAQLRELAASPLYKRGEEELEKLAQTARSFVADAQQNTAPAPSNPEAVRQLERAQRYADAAPEPE